MTNKKALVFLRAYNDIDHIVPVLYKWASVEEVTINIIITTQPDYLDDFRLGFLKRSPKIDVRYIRDFLTEEERRRHREAETHQAGRPTLFTKAYNRLAYTIHLKSPEASPPPSYPDPWLVTPEFVTRIFDTVFTPGTRGLVIFDWIIPADFVKAVLGKARERGFPTVSLPHGDSPYYNLMENINDIDYSRLESYRRNGTVFDYLVVPNQLCARRYNQFMGPDRLKVLGSPRYNNEWLEIMSKLLPEFKGKAGPDKLNVAFFLRPLDYSIHWEEVLRTIKLVVQFPEVHLVVKHHTRKSSVKRLVQTYPGLAESRTDNLEFVFDEVNSGSLIKWADVVLDIGTSATFEAVIYGKPVLALEYLQANYLTISHYMHSCEMNCRDHVYDMLRNFIADRRYKFYDEAARVQFIREVIGDPSNDILAGYVKFLSGCLDAVKEG